jgi:hypothetical protein
VQLAPNHRNQVDNQNEKHLLPYWSRPEIVPLDVEIGEAALLALSR